MIRKKQAAVFTVLWVAVMVLIFFFSNDDADASSAKSGAVVVIVETVEEILDITPTQEIRDITEMIVRKCAHVFLYTCLAVTGMLAVREYVWAVLAEPRRKIHVITALVTWLCCFLYACTDEWHQTFRSGRSGSFRDVLIDSIGIVLGIGVVTLVRVLWNYFRRERDSKNIQAS